MLIYMEKTFSASCELEQLMFSHFDANGDGKISPSELLDGMRAAGGEEMSLEEMKGVVECADLDGDGMLGFEEFKKLVEDGGEEEKGRSLREAFKVYEMEGEECITPKSLKRALGRLGEAKTIDECRVMIRRFDLNGDGVISFDEFRNMMA